MSRIRSIDPETQNIHHIPAIHMLNVLDELVRFGLLVDFDYLDVVITFILECGLRHNETEIAAPVTPCA
jgi:hypothetical protein